MLHSKKRFSYAEGMLGVNEALFDLFFQAHLLTQRHFLKQRTGARAQIGLSKALGPGPSQQEVLREVLPLGTIRVKPPLHALHVCEEVDDICTNSLHT